MLDKIHDPHFLREKRVIGTVDGVFDLPEEDHDDEHMRDVDLPDPAQDAHARDQKTGFPHRAAVDERRRIARNENEDLGGVAKSVIADREPGQEIGRQMIDEDQPQRQAAEQIDPQFPFARNRRCHDGRRRGVLRHRIRHTRKGRHGNRISNRHPLAPSEQDRPLAAATRGR